MSAVSEKDITGKSTVESFAPGEPLSLVSFCLDSDTQRIIRSFATLSSLVEVRAHLSTYGAEGTAPIPDSLTEPMPDICMVDFDQDRGEAALIAERIRAQAPSVAIFAASSHSEPALIIEAMRAGCTEYMVKPLERDQLLAALARVGGRKKEKKEIYRAQILTFVGSKGGCGVTTITTQMGVSLASNLARKTLLIDDSPEFGDAALYLGVTKYQYHFRELLENTYRLDAELLQSFVMHHDSGLDMIPGPDGPEPSTTHDTAGITRTFDFLRSRYEFILVDARWDGTDENLELLRLSDQIYLVTVGEVSAIRNTYRQLEYLDQHGIPADKVRVIVNRHQKNNPISDDQIEKSLDRKVFWKVPSQYAQVIKTITGADPIETSTSEVARSLKDIAAAVGKKPTVDKKKEGRGFLGLLGR